MEITAVLGSLVLLDVLAVRSGRDSRDLVRRCRDHWSSPWSSTSSWSRTVVR